MGSYPYEFALEYYRRARGLVFGDPRDHLDSTDSHWKPKNASAIVTGGNVGLGKETVEYLAALGWDVTLACRTVSKGEDAKKDIQSRVQTAKITVEELDLESFRSVQDFAKRYKDSKKPLHVLCNNAGRWVSERSKTGDGIETTIQTNHLSPMLLTLLLLPVLKSTEGARVVNIASRGHYISDWRTDDPECEKVDPYEGRITYGHSKMANVLFTKRFVKEYPEIYSFAVHPGLVHTQFTRFVPSYSGVTDGLLWLVAKSAAVGAHTQQYLSTAPIDKLVNGEYYGDCEILVTSSGVNEKAADACWDWSMDKITKYLK
eukprot:Clim_evm19s14 gene=Clim_evmTU19s14